MEEKPVINILLVEDHALTRMGLKAAFRRTSDICVIGEAANGEEAIEKARELSPNVILMDVGMPVMDGIQASRHIVAEFPHMKIVMLTQHDNDSDILASLAAGASGYCLKDVEPERLYTAVRSVNAGDAWLDSTIASRVLRHYSMPAAMAPASSDAAVSVAAPEPVAAAPFEDVTDRPAPDALSVRELEVLKLIVDGMSNQEIADKLTISLATAKTHVRNILNKLAVDDRTQAAVHAMRRRLV
ncbi:MAG: response regulator transcription factor [Cyanobacteria bacterium SZAS LIN-3]|nr:response regulator transcription factor [Cyanobacteria bacterium SZAS LIN-3]MBS2009285.1 response regulator transcription factor [Cyanobacteria bacterium SZAS TMP-1]